MYSKYQPRTQPLLTHEKCNSLSASISTGRRWAIWEPTCWPWTALFTQSRGQMLPSHTDVNTLKHSSCHKQGETSCSSFSEELCSLCGLAGFRETINPPVIKPWDNSNNGQNNSFGLMSFGRSTAGDKLNFLHILVQQAMQKSIFLWNLAGSQILETGDIRTVHRKV